MFILYTNKLTARAREPTDSGPVNICWSSQDLDGLGNERNRIPGPVGALANFDLEVLLK